MKQENVSAEHIVNVSMHLLPKCNKQTSQSKKVSAEHIVSVEFVLINRQKKFQQNVLSSRSP